MNLNSGPAASHIFENFTGNCCKLVYKKILNPDDVGEDGVFEVLYAKGIKNIGDKLVHQLDRVQSLIGVDRTTPQIIPS